MAKNQGYDITGRKFGKLVVLSKGESKGPGRTTWNCICDCGNEKNIRGDALKSGYTKSCGKCNRSFKRLDSLFSMVPISVNDIKNGADLAGLSFGEYVAKEFVNRVTGGGSR